MKLTDARSKLSSLVKLNTPTPIEVNGKLVAYLVPTTVDHFEWKSGAAYEVRSSSASAGISAQPAEAPARSQSHARYDTPAARALLTKMTKAK